MKQLILIRHAKSSWVDPDLSDRDRPLNNRGKRDAPFMGKRLKKEHNVKSDLILSSPAKRAIGTARIIAKAIGYPKEKIEIKDSLYGSGVTAMLNVIQYLDDSLNEVMLFGHNPDHTSLANYLSNQQVDNIPTCGVFCVDFDIQSWQDVKKGEGIFKFFDYPKKS
ncbi:MAG: histidine phosphatase family protein [bacterium]|jgi:phosphohistidine phosphatase|nr:histidine phosphatase family protein [bacterium]